jgi:putative membrane protein
MGCHADEYSKRIAKESKRIAEENNEKSLQAGSGLQDAQMLVDLASMEYGVIELSKAANKQSHNRNIQHMAEMLQQDHALLLKQLQQYAANRNISIPDEATAHDERVTNRLENGKVVVFDKKWCANMLNRHEQVIAAMEDDATIAADTNLRTWINDVLPKVRMHRDELMQIKYTIR